MIVLGINDEHDAGCVLVKDGELIAAYEEERFSRKKQHNGQSDGMPRLSLREILKDNNIRPSDIDVVATGFPKGGYLMKQVYKTLLKENNPKWLFSGLFNKDFHGIGDYFYPYFYATRKRFRLKKLLKEFGLGNKRIIFTDHHLAHAASAFYTSGFDESLILTLDGHGSGVSGSVCVGRGIDIDRKSIISKYDSVGLLYSTVTAGLGFKPGRHEGKILGLAAFGDSNVYYKKFKDMIKCDGEDIDLVFMRKYPSPIYPHFISYKKVFKQEFGWFDGKREDLCAALQRRTEEVVVEWVLNAVKKYGVSKISVAGGVFANVKINQRISELFEVDFLQVFPAMSDSGLAAGAALNAYYRLAQPKKNVTKFTNTYLGKEFSELEIKYLLDKLDIPYTYDRNIEKTIAELLNRNKVVCRYNGPTEFGPRALGNRSILYSGKDKEVNVWLNKKLDRTEFMPFAPSVLVEDAGLYFERVEKHFPQPADFMTITFDCKDKMREDCPAAVHVDNTARPQFVRKETNPSYHKIISEYKRLSGSSVIVNTSFNVHEEPIVNSPKDAVRSFLFTRLDVLALGNFLILKESI